jgi:hypothetical protein
MTTTALRLTSEWWDIPESIKHRVIRSAESDSPIEILRTSDRPAPENKAALDLLPLSELGFNSEQYRIISVTERTKPYDRLLTPPGFVEKNLPRIAKKLNIYAVEKRTIQQWKTISPTEADLLESPVDLQSAVKKQDRGLIVPWWFSVKELLSSNWTELELHPAEFTPRPGSGCWAITDRGESDDQLIAVLREIHHPASVVITNAERKLMRDFGRSDLEIKGILIDRPLEDKYHLYICIEDKQEGGIHYLDYPCSALGNLNEEAQRLIDQYFDREKT